MMPSIKRKICCIQVQSKVRGYQDQFFNNIFTEPARRENGRCPYFSPYFLFWKVKRLVNPQEGENGRKNGRCPYL